MTKAGYKPTEEPQKPAPKKPNKRKKPRKKINTAALVSCIIFAVAVVIAAGLVSIWRYTQPYLNTFLPGCRLMGRALDGMSAQQASDLLGSLTKDRVRDWKASLYWGDQVFTLTAEDIALAVDERETLDPLWQVGRTGGMLSRFQTILQQRIQAKEAQLAVRTEEEPLDEMIADIERAVNQEPVNATVQMERGSATPFRFTDEAEGYRLNAAALRESILSAALALEPLEEEVKPEVLRPAVTRSALEKATVLRARVTATLGEGAAADNASLALSVMDGICLSPGSRWSFNEAVGPRTQESGYVFAPEEAYGSMAEGVGGGVCQASTLLYRLALLADVKVEERHAAAYPTSYAEAGQEAAVSDQGLDLVLENQTDYPLWLRVRSWTDGDSKMAELQLIGEALPETIALESDVQEIPAPADPVYVRDREGRYALYTDEQVKVSDAQPGYRSVTKRIRMDGNGAERTRETISEDTYEAVPERIYIGAKER